MLSIENLSIYQNDRWLWQNVNLTLNDGERLGICAPSGYGKSTLGRVLAGWQPFQSGQLLLDGQPIDQKGYYPIQLIPQHPEKTFNPYRQIQKSLFDAWHPSTDDYSRFLINPDLLSRRPAQLSGGELARLAILRALDPRTRCIVADEITAQLDPVTQKHIWLNLVQETQTRQLSMIIFSHNKALLTKVCHRIWVP